jgi:hypothetical protein
VTGESWRRRINIPEFPWDIKIFGIHNAGSNTKEGVIMGQKIVIYGKMG